MSRMVRRARARVLRHESKGARSAKIVASVCAGITAACSADPAPVRTVGMTATSAVEAPTATASASATSAVEYLLSDVERRPSATWVALDKGRHGVLIDGARAIASESGVTIVPETADTGIQKVDRVPARLGGGFLFRTSSALYASASFDGPLRPVAAIGSISDISFGPDTAFVRDYSGMRWSIDLATGARKAPSPLGVADVAALDDGRAIAILEGGGASISTDGGKTWANAGAQLQGSPAYVTTREGELWLGDRQGARTLRLERSGALVEMTTLPPATPPVKPDPRFANGDSPLKTALRSGVRVGPWTAVIGAGGDVLRVDLATGAIVATFPGVLPLRMTCEAIEIPDDVALVCSERSKASVVVTNLLHGKKPRIERSFPADGPFFAGEDGALAFGGPCGTASERAADSATPAAPSAPSTTGSTGAPSPPPPTVCVRNGDGQWEPFLLDEANGAPSGSSSASPGKSPPSSSASASARTPPPAAKPNIRPDDVRWIPRLGRAPVAVIAGKQLASYDAAWGEIRAWQTDGQPSQMIDALRRHAAPRYGAPIVDRRWVATASGAVQAILDDGRGVEVSPDGAVQVWPFTFDKVATAGALGFAKGGGGRAFQTLDRGRTWDEVAAPPGPQSASFDPRDCSSLGCDLGQWLRIGWNPTPPAARPEMKKATPPPMLPVAPPIEMACLATGKSEARAVPTSLEHPFDRALGTSRLPAKFDDLTFRFDLATLGRSGANVPRTGVTIPSDTAPRAMVFGFHLDLEPSDDPKEEWGHIVVQGPSRQQSAYKQDFFFVEPLVPSAPLRRTSYKLDGITKAIKEAGVTLHQLVQADHFNVVAVVPIMPAPAAKGRSAPQGDVILTLSPTALGTLYVVGHGGSSPHTEILFARDGGILQSAARLANGDLAAIVVGDDGDERLLRFTSSGVTEVGSLPPPPSSAAPANPDAIAIGPKGELAIVRTPSGSEPPSASDPALLIHPGPKLTALAPWASAVPASDPSCSAAGDDMYRATIQTSGSWVKIAGHPLPIDTLSGMTARVRWSATRLCIEAVEVPDGTDITQLGVTTEAFVIATFSPDDAGRSDIELGSEERTSMSCALSPR